MSIFLSWLVLALIIYLTAMLLPGFEVKGFGGALIVAAIFGILNWAIGWLLFVLIGIATLGLGFLLAFLTRWLVNAILLLVVSGLSERFRVRSFGVALLGAAVMAGLGTLAQWIFPGLR
jgi:putative membrane protein